MQVMLELQIQVEEKKGQEEIWNSQYLGEEGDAIGEVGEYLGDDGDIWAGARDRQIIT